MRKHEYYSALWLRLLLVLCGLPFVIGCGGTSDPPIAPKAPIAKADKDDPDVYRPPTKPAPPPAVQQTSKGNPTKQAMASDPDVFVPEVSPKLPTTSPKNAAGGNNISAMQKAVNRMIPSLPAANANGKNSTEFDPDYYTADKGQPTAGQKNTAAKKEGSREETRSLQARIRLYESDRTEEAAQIDLEKEFVSESREAILATIFNPPHATTSPTAEADRAKGLELWNKPFIDYLHLKHQALMSLAQRPSAVALAALTPNAAMRANLRRTLARHWSEGPKVFHDATAKDCLQAEPGFLTVLKSLIRENQSRSAHKQNTARQAQPNFEATRSEESDRTSAESNWNAMLEDLTRDYCRRCHLASLARSAKAFGSDAAASLASDSSDSPLPLLPGCEPIAAHRFQWRGENASLLPQGSENYLAIDYRRFEKRMKANKPLLFYRRQLDSCIEHSLANGLWLDGFKEKKAGNRACSVDVLITWPKTSDPENLNEEQELTVEILVIEVQKSID
jgi:hypothetical protein